MASTTLEREAQISAIGVVSPPPILIQTPTFEGTLATLFRCVRESKVDLMEVPLEPICEAYLQHVVSADESSLDEAAAALTVLAYLIERKAWLLLPAVDEEEPEFEEPVALPDPTMYAYAEIINALIAGHHDRSKLFFRTVAAEPGTYEVPVSLGDVSTDDLARAFARLLRKVEPTVELLSKPRRSIQEQIKLVLASLKPEFQTLEEMITGPFTRLDAVYWFLALLELIRLQRAKAAIVGEDVKFARG